MTKTNRMPIFGPQGLETSSAAAPVARYTFSVAPHTKYRVNGTRWVGTNFCVAHRAVVMSAALERTAYQALPVSHETSDAQVVATVATALKGGVPLRWLRHECVVPYVFYVAGFGEDQEDLPAGKALLRPGARRVDTWLAPYAPAGAPRAIYIDDGCKPPSVLYATSPVPLALVDAPEPELVQYLVAPCMPLWGPAKRAAELVVKGMSTLGLVLTCVDALTEAMAMPDREHDAALFECLRGINTRGMRCAPVVEEALRTFPCSYEKATEMRSRIEKALR